MFFTHENCFLYNVSKKNIPSRSLSLLMKKKKQLVLQQNQMNTSSNQYREKKSIKALSTLVKIKLYSIRKFPDINKTSLPNVVYLHWENKWVIFTLKKVYCTGFTVMFTPSQRKIHYPNTWNERRVKFTLAREYSTLLEQYFVLQEEYFLLIIRGERHY